MLPEMTELLVSSPKSHLPFAKKCLKASMLYSPICLRHTTSTISSLEQVTIMSLHTNHPLNQLNLGQCQVQSCSINVCSALLPILHLMFLTDYSANLCSEVQPTLASASNFQFIPHPSPSQAPRNVCKIGAGCPLLLECTTAFIRCHLREHGCVHKDRERAGCPWQGCGMEMRWTNVARHIKEIHLDVRLPCWKCGRGFKRKETLEVHTNKCN